MIKYVHVYSCPRFWKQGWPAVCSHFLLPFLSLFSENNLGTTTLLKFYHFMTVTMRKNIFFFSLLSSQGTVFKVLLITLPSSIETQNTIPDLWAKRLYLSFYPSFLSAPLSPAEHRTHWEQGLKHLGSSKGHTLESSIVILISQCYLPSSANSLSHCQKDGQSAYSVPSHKVKLLYGLSLLPFLLEAHLTFPTAKQRQGSWDYTRVKKE